MPRAMRAEGRAGRSGLAWLVAAVGVVVVAALVGRVRADVCNQCQCWNRGGRKVVDCSFLDLTHVPDEYPDDAYTIYLNGNLFTRIKADSFGRLRKLKKLYLHNNPSLKTIDDRAFEKLNNLKTLLLHHTAVTRVTNLTFAGLGNVETLWMHEANVKSIAPTAFVGMAALHELDMSNNPIQRLHNCMFANTTELDKLYLHSDSATYNLTCQTLCGVRHKSKIEANFVSRTLECGSGCDATEFAGTDDDIGGLCPAATDACFADNCVTFTIRSSATAWWRAATTRWLSLVWLLPLNQAAVFGFSFRW